MKWKRVLMGCFNPRYVCNDWMITRSIYGGGYMIFRGDVCPTSERFASLADAKAEAERLAARIPAVLSGEKE